MIQKVRIQTTNGSDIKAKSVLHDITHVLKIRSIKKIESVKVYRLEGITEKQAKLLTEKLFAESLNQIYSINRPLLNGNSHTLEIAYKPGVMNPEVASILKSAHDLGIKLKAADTSWEYGFLGEATREAIKEMARKINLFNKTVEHIVEEEPKTLFIKGVVGQTTTISLLEMNDAQLLELSKDKLFLNLEEMKVIQKYYQKIKKNPTDCELETIAQTWSEHCAHKTFKANLIVDGKKKASLISRIKKESLKHKKNIVSAFVDNSGVMNFYQGWALCGKAETHNSPSAIEPYGGAMTGSGGVFRDVVGTGQGAKAIVSTDIFCFAPYDMDLKLLPQGCLPPEYLLKRCVAAVRDYGNRVGIPTNNGSFHFHDDFRAKPTVLVGSYGIIPKRYAQKGKPKKGDVVVAIGGRTGRDGIHGATFSSGEMTERTITVNSSAVQIGNAIEEKRMFDAILEARDQHLIRAIQDCGAGGFSSAIGEMGEKIGVSVNLENAPLKYQGLAPWEIWISESQERMVVSVAKKNLKKFISVCQKNNVEASVLGTFDGSKKLKVFFEKQFVCNLDMKFLHHDLPTRTMIAKKPTNSSLRNNLPTQPTNEKQWLEIIKSILAHGNVNSKEPIVRLYDHSVQGTNDLQPFSGELLDGPNDAVVLRPLLQKPYGMIVSHGLNPILNRINPYWGSMWALTEALSNYVAVGGDFKNASLINNYIWPFPDEEGLWSLNQSVEAVCDFMRILKTPVISGKDSLSSTYRGKDGMIIKVPPVLCISAFGKIENAQKTITSDFKKEGSLIYLVGKLHLNGMGGSVYFDINGIPGQKVPQVSLSHLPKLYSALYKGIQKGKILSCHDISEGGLVTSLFEMCVGGNMGATISLSKIDNKRPDFMLFNETAGCFLIEVENRKVAQTLFKSLPYKYIGKTQQKHAIEIVLNNQTFFSANMELLKRTWQNPMKKLFQ